MARKIQVLFIGDIDGSPAEVTIWFGLGGTGYEIDLNAQHAQALRTAPACDIDAGRRGPGPRRPARTRPHVGRTDRRVQCSHRQ